MDNYPIHYVEHNTPLLVLSGLPDPTEPVDLSQHAGQAATYITCPIPPVDTPLAKTLLKCFLATSESGIWFGRFGRSPNSLRGQNPVFRVKAVGRVSLLLSIHWAFMSHTVLFFKGLCSTLSESKFTSIIPSNIFTTRGPGSPYTPFSSVPPFTPVSALPRWSHHTPLDA